MNRNNKNEKKWNDIEVKETELQNNDLKIG